MELRQIIIKELPPPAILVNIKLYLIFLLSTTIIFLQWLSMDYICCLSEEWQWCRNYLEKRIYLFCSYCRTEELDVKITSLAFVMTQQEVVLCDTVYFGSFQTIRFVSIPEKPQINLAQKSENFYDISAHVLPRGRGCGESNVIRAYRHALLSMEMGSSSARFID